PPAAAPHASIARGDSPGAWISQNASPPIEFMCGYTTAMVAAADTMASTALPPSRRTATADCAASAWGATAIPRMPHAAVSPDIRFRTRIDDSSSVPGTARRCATSIAFCHPIVDTTARKNHKPRGESGMRALLRLAFGIDKLNERIGKAVAWLGLAAVIVCTGNAVARYAFNIGSNAWLELQWY